MSYLLRLDEVVSIRIVSDMAMATNRQVIHTAHYRHSLAVQLDSTLYLLLSAK